MSHRELDDMLGKGWRKPHFIPNPTLRYGLIAGFIAYLIAAVLTIEVDWGRVYEGLDRGWQFILAFTRPDFVSRAGDIWEGLLESIVMTVAASVVGILISIPIGLGAGRIGNFLNGELWGRVTDLPWAMVFPGAGPDPRHPSQLYQALLEGLAMFVILWAFSSRPRPLRAVSASVSITRST